MLLLGSNTYKANTFEFQHVTLFRDYVVVVSKNDQVELEDSTNDAIVMNPQSRGKRNVGLPKHLQKDYVLPSWKK
jgi:hypothetical protein